MSFRKNRSIIILYFLLFVLILSACTKKQEAISNTLTPLPSEEIEEVSAYYEVFDIIDTDFIQNIDTENTIDDIPEPFEPDTGMDEPYSEHSDSVDEEMSEELSNVLQEATSGTKGKIAIDAGHQRKGNYDTEPIGPGSNKTKPKVTSGTQGVSSKVPEYELALIISLMLKDELINRGYEIYMIRESHDVNISNSERARMANDSGADIFIRIHADSSNDQNVNGASTLYPSSKNPYVSHLSAPSLMLSELIIHSLCESTGGRNRGAIPRDDMSGINWCTIPVTIIEMGYMSNPEEDKLMQTDAYRAKIVQGICDGIDQYFNH